MTFPYGWRTVCQHTHLSGPSCFGWFGIAWNLKPQLWEGKSPSIISSPVLLSAQGGFFPLRGSWYGSRYHWTPVGWMLHKVRVLCFIDLTPSIKTPPPPFFYHDSTRIITLSSPCFLFPMHQPPHHVPCVLRLDEWLVGVCGGGGVGGGGGLPLDEPLWRSLGLNHVYPHPLPPLPPPRPSSLCAGQIDDSHPFFPPDSRLFAVPLIHPRDRPRNTVNHQQDLSLFALPCCKRNKSVCLRPEHT